MHSEKSILFVCSDLACDITCSIFCTDINSDQECMLSILVYFEHWVVKIETRDMI